MHFVIMILVFKIALTVFMVLLGAMFMADFFPVLADKAIAASNGSLFEAVGQGVAVGLNFVAKYAQIVVDLIFDWLQVIGIEMDRNFMKNGLQDVNLDAPKDVEKPDF